MTVAHTGAEGLSRAAQSVPELVVLDLGLPDIDGVEVCKRLRQWTEVPVIVLSAQTARTARFSPSTPGQMTTSPNPSECTSWRHGFASASPLGRAQPHLGRFGAEGRADPPGPGRPYPGREVRAGRAHRTRVRSDRVLGPQRRQGLYTQDDLREVWGQDMETRPTTCVFTLAASPQARRGSRSASPH